MQRGGWMAEPRHCTDTPKEDTPAGSHAYERRNVERRGSDHVGISGTTGDLGTALAWLRPAALLQSSPPFGD